jgi:hypothetical protein
MCFADTTDSWNRGVALGVALLSGCRSYVLDLDEFEAARSPWQHAAELMLAAAKSGDLEEVVSSVFSSIRTNWFCRVRPYAFGVGRLGKSLWR